MVGKFERGKDTVQELTESAATHVGAIAVISTFASVAIRFASASSVSLGAPGVLIAHATFCFGGTW